jgi:hypothetical protein
LLIELKEKQDTPYVRSLLAFALTYSAAKDDVEEMRALLSDLRNEDVRDELEKAIKKAPKR